MGIHLLGQRHIFADRHVRVYCHNLAPQLRKHPLWVARHAHQQACVCLRPEIVLPVRQVEKRQRRFGGVAQLRVLQDAGDLVRLVIYDQNPF